MDELSSLSSLAYTFNIPFETFVAVSLYSMFFVSLYILLKKINPFFLVPLIFSPLFIENLLSFKYLTLTYQLFTFSVALYLLDRKKLFHSAFASSLLSLISPDASAPIVLLYLLHYFKSREKKFLISSLLLALFLPFSSFDLSLLKYNYLQLSLFLPYTFTLPAIAVLSLLLSIFPSSFFFLLYAMDSYLKENRFNIDKLIFSLILYSLLLASLKLELILFILFPILIELNKNRIHLKIHNYLLILFSIINILIFYFIVR